MGEFSRRYIIKIQLQPFRVVEHTHRPYTLSLMDSASVKRKNKKSNIFMK